MLLALLLFVSCHGGAVPRFNLEPGSTTVSGISSGADFAAQFFTAFSSSLLGASIFAGQAPGCAILRFPGEASVPCSSQPWYAKGPGCVGGVETPAPCVGCPGNETLRYDHCKVHPGLQNATLLREQLEQWAAQGLIDKLEHLVGKRLYLYKGTLDAVYWNNSVSIIGDILEPWVGSDNVHYENTIPSIHAWPTRGFGAPCGLPSPVHAFPPAMEDCNYDGSGEALQFMYTDLTPPPSDAPIEGSMPLITIDQTEFFGPSFAGLSSKGFVYAPKQCQEGATCRLHVQFHGCSMTRLNPAMGLNFTLNTGSNRWADANNLVIFYPQNGGYIEFPQYHTDAYQMAPLGCWDAYGQSGELYATKRGLQMDMVFRMAVAMGLK